MGHLRKVCWFVFGLFILSSMEAKYNELTKAEEYVLEHKGTERPGSGDLLKNKEAGTYICARCNAPLYRSEDKFESHCGWPSFDDEIDGAVRRETDRDGRRVEILCENCDGHLGHVFKGEGFTAKNTRHCVNSLSMNFIAEGEVLPHVLGATEKAYFAGGCFWGMEYWFEQQEGVESVVSGMGYAEGVENKDQIVEVVEVSYYPGTIDFSTLAKFFFEIHDPTQLDRQGPDVGREYRSVGFYNSASEKAVLEGLILRLKSKDLDVVTTVEEFGRFVSASDKHQDYYEKNGGFPHCHTYKKRF